MNIPMPQPGGQMPQKVSRAVQRMITPSGRLVELREVEITSLANNTLFKENYLEIDPPTADSSMPKDLSEVKECGGRCLGLYKNENVETCMRCGVYCCTRCRVEVPQPRESQDLVLPRVIPPKPAKYLCATCLEESQLTVFHRLARRFWRLR